MPILEHPITLKTGTAAEMARRSNWTEQHIRLVAKGKREGSEDLLRALRNEAKRQAKNSPKVV